MIPVSTLAIVALALAAPALARAQTKADDHAAHHPAVSASAATAGMATGEVRKVDKEGAKLTLKHGEIKSLDMPPMTMVFGVKDKAVLDRVKVGDQVRFKAVNEAGRFTITEIVVLP